MEAKLEGEKVENEAAELAALASLYLENEYVCVRMDKNESFCLTSIVVLFSFLLTNNYGSAEILIGLIGTIYAGICWQKSNEYRRFFRRILAEIRATERSLAPRKGLWATRLYADDSQTLNISRTVFWPIVNMASWLCWFFICVKPNLPTAT